jgi:hypothetical protein
MKLTFLCRSPMHHQQQPSYGGGGGGYPGQSYHQQAPAPAPSNPYGYSHSSQPPQQYGSPAPQHGYNVRSHLDGDTFRIASYYAGTQIVDMDLVF